MPNGQVQPRKGTHLSPGLVHRRVRRYRKDVHPFESEPRTTTMLLHGKHPLCPCATEPASAVRVNNTCVGASPDKEGLLGSLHRGRRLRHVSGADNCEGHRPLQPIYGGRCHLGLADADKEWQLTRGG